MLNKLDLFKSGAVLSFGVDLQSTLGGNRHRPKNREAHPHCLDEKDPGALKLEAISRNRI